MDPCPSENSLLDALEDRSGPEAAARLHRHIRHCDRCRSVLAGMARVLAPSPVDTEPAVDEGTAPAGPLPGDCIAGYRILNKLGEGGMGAVYAGYNDQIGHRAAIKVLHPRYSRDAEAAARFFNEARAVNIIQHPGIVGISRLDRLPSGAAYIVMEHLSGESLRARMRCRLSQDQALRLSGQIAQALLAAHDKGIVHRDLKPENVMVVADPAVPGGERTKLLDFGLAKLAEDLVPAGSRAVRTRSGVVMGSPRYMAPEQCRGTDPVDGRADVYALGVMLFEMLAGRPPFASESPGELIAMHLTTAPPRIEALVAGIRADVAQLLHQMLAKDPAGRPAMAEVVRRLHGGRPPTRARLRLRPLWPVLGTALAATLVVAALAQDTLLHAGARLLFVLGDLHDARGDMAGARRGDLRALLLLGRGGYSQNLAALARKAESRGARAEVTEAERGAAQACSARHTPPTPADQGCAAIFLQRALLTALRPEIDAVTARKVVEQAERTALAPGVLPVMRALFASRTGNEQEAHAAYEQVRDALRRGALVSTDVQAVSAIAHAAPFRRSAAEHFGGCLGIVVAAVDSPSRAEAAGLRRNDILLRLFGNRCLNEREDLLPLKSESSESLVPLELLRDGVLHKLSVHGTGGEWFGAYPYAF